MFYFRFTINRKHPPAPDWPKPVPQRRWRHSPSSSPVLGLTSKRGKLLDEMSSRMRWPARNRLAVLMVRLVDLAPSNLNSYDSQQRHPEQTKDAASDNTEYVQTNAKSSPGFKSRCRNCGKELSGTPVYCRYCGVKARVESKFCPTCGSPTYDTADFCTKCGTSLR